MTTETRAATSAQPSRLLSALRTQEGVLFLVLVVIVIVLSLLSDRFLTVNNLLNQTRLFTETALLALPMTLIIISGGIDLSVGSMLAWSAVMLGFSWQLLGLPLPLAVVVCLLTGAIGGAINGALIAYVRVPPLIATLATLAIYRGFSFGISQARSARGFPEEFAFWGQGQVGPFPTQFLILVVLIVAMHLLLARTGFGRWVYAIGNNELAARYSGIPVERVKFTLYTLSGLMAGLAAFIFTSRVTTTRADAATGLELDVIAAVVLGGTSIFGGSGSVIGTMLGLVIITLLRNGLLLTGVKGDATFMVIGLVLIAAVLINNLVRRR
ncbi:MAG: ABC transporter permease [Anaerolineae bacterium]|nr:ABC transporter permease [Thermoflexales bacterium]MDW8053998.1 ABC transporter permease [Anaerolineae bacterium]